jgi:hypothetical protein
MAGGGRLLILNAATSTVEQDLTNAIAGFTLREIERLSVCSDAARVVAGSRTSFLLVEVPTQKVIFKSQGRFPALSPDGRRLAYVDEHHQLCIRDLTTQVNSPVMRGALVYGVGSWNPEGTLLLVGGWTSLSWWKRLVAVDVLDGSSVELARLGEGDFGGGCLWVSRHLLSA